MTNKKINTNRRWRRFAELNADPFYCTSALAIYAEFGEYLDYTPTQNKEKFKRTNCGRCGKCKTNN